jgi:biotin carboxyl carrier protein
VKIKDLQEYVDVMKKRGLYEIDMKHSAGSIHIVRAADEDPSAGEKKEGSREPIAKEQEETIEKEEKGENLTIKSEMVGIFNLSLKNNGEIIAEGDVVKKGDIVYFIEAMNVRNEFRSPVDGVIEEIFVRTDHAVEYGEPLIEVRKE